MWNQCHVCPFHAGKFMKLLCKIGIHKYEDHIKIDKVDLKTQQVLIESTEICRWCKKIRNQVKIYVGAAEKCQKILSAETKQRK